MVDVINEAETILKENSFEGFCDKINEGFNSLVILSELQKSGNEDVLKIFKDVENGR